MTDTQPPVSTGADRDLQLQPGRTQLLGDIFGEIQKSLVRKQLSPSRLGRQGAMGGQARRVLRWPITAPVLASVCNGSNQAPWFWSIFSSRVGLDLPWRQIPRLKATPKWQLFSARHTQISPCLCSLAASGSFRVPGYSFPWFVQVPTGMGDERKRTSSAGGVQ